jgi:hypothetical protein
MLIIAYVLDRGGWCVVDMCAANQVKSGTYSTPEEAAQAAQTMGWRIAQGWKP